MPDSVSENDAGHSAWTHVGSLGVFAVGPIVPVRIAGQELLLVQDGDQVFAVERACPHEGADLANGRCSVGRLFCPHHQASFALSDGAVSPGWSFRRLRTFPVQAVDGKIYINTLGLIDVRSESSVKLARVD